MAFHARSISLPSESHPFTLSVEDQLCKLRSGEQASSSTSVVCQKLDNLQMLYESVDSLLQMSHTQQAFSHGSENKCVGYVLDGSLRLLDLCGTTRDVFSQMKGCVQDLESSLRRRTCREKITHEIQKYISSKRKVKKMVLNLKRMNKRNSESLNKDCKLPAVVDTLSEVEQVSLTMFESLLSFVSPSMTRSTSILQSIVSTVTGSKHVSPKGDDNYMNEVEKLDVSLAALNNHQSKKSVEEIDVQNVRKNLQELESTIQEIEQGLECVFRCLIKNRVSLLNILNH